MFWYSFRFCQEFLQKFLKKRQQAQEDKEKKEAAQHQHSAMNTQDKKHDFKDTTHFKTLRHDNKLFDVQAEAQQAAAAKKQAKKRASQADAFSQKFVGHGHTRS